MDATGTGPEPGSRSRRPDDQRDPRDRVRVPPHFLRGLHLTTEEPSDGRQFLARSLADRSATGPNGAFALWRICYVELSDPGSNTNQAIDYGVCNER